MFGNSHFDRVREIFADQFEQDANGFRYRRGMKGAAYRVSEAERDQFVATFNKRLRYASWAIAPATIILILLLAWLIPDSDGELAKGAIWGGVAAILIPFLAIYYWAWNAPARELQRRTPESAALTREEARSLAFSKITYGQLGLAAAFGVGLVWMKSVDEDVFHGWGMIWLVSGVGLVALSVVQAIRKWRHGQQ